ncbi:DUF7218 family protein [Arthrobacter sp. SA17]
MPEKKNPSVKDPKLYESFGTMAPPSKKAARISNAAAKKGRSSVGKKAAKPVTTTIGPLRS